ncbi:TraY domain-containing protein [Vibrio parahaemolyticus]|uniref:Relaxosome protein TraY n=1 Tax=Vibrio parahaemolyticus TaxID=670 RepID=A0A9Q3UHV4_VIBPH|nr:TraY domain-containing protein [Vibrio parahaemolyticus]MCC3807531.1 TraY domain-containing protein [Vibrio parahaemolyticus]MCI9696499.1 TraY domain-containing protein [Vibrio parahaemolyticus]MCI9711037.1 TraY domain-containing protein [Vibrio parahaemolyticus]MCI9715917.1 TraY domain-containing protein [Vibrio parahaemolyticus]
MHKNKPDDSMTGIWFDMDAETNRLLTTSAKTNKRTKRQEASFRLSHHLRKFDKHFNPSA